MLHSHVLNRELHTNFITSIPNGAFIGLRSLIVLFAASTRCTMRVCFILMSSTGVSLGTESHQFLSAFSLNSAACSHCLLHWLCTACFVRHSSVIIRDLSNNLITSISNGAFAGLGSLTTMLNASSWCLIYCLHDCGVQNSDLDLNEIILLEIGAFSTLSKLSTL